MSELKQRWAGIDDEYEEKTESGAIYDYATGEFLFRVPPEYRPLIVTAVNSYDALIAERDKLKAESEDLTGRIGGTDD